jgi:signal transduction histidine kinase
VIQCNIRDISARANATLAFVSRVAALELSSKAKDDVLATLSHELRTPLTAISCAADLLILDQDASGALPGRKWRPKWVVRPWRSSGATRGLWWD